MNGLFDRREGRFLFGSPEEADNLPCHGSLESFPVDRSIACVDHVTVVHPHRRPIFHRRRHYPSLLAIVRRRPSLLAAIHRCSPLPIVAHRCPSLLTAIQRCSPLSHRCQPLSVVARALRCSPLSDVARRCLSLLTAIHCCSSLSVIRPCRRVPPGVVAVLRDISLE